jgi:hypothetical protein
MNQVVSHLGEVKSAVSNEAEKVGNKAEANLSTARASTHWHKILGPEHLTRTSVSHGDVDSFANLEAPNAMAIEFGHAPSGVFGPGGRYAHIKTKAPEGLYILSRAAGLAG